MTAFGTQENPQSVVTAAQGIGLRAQAVDPNLAGNPTELDAGRLVREPVDELLGPGP